MVTFRLSFTVSCYSHTYRIFCWSSFLWSSCQSKAWVGRCFSGRQGTGNRKGCIPDPSLVDMVNVIGQHCRQIPQAWLPLCNQRLSILRICLVALRNPLHGIFKHSCHWSWPQRSAKAQKMQDIMKKILKNGLMNFLELLNLYDCMTCRRVSCRDKASQLGLASLRKFGASWRDQTPRLTGS